MKLNVLVPLSGASFSAETTSSKAAVCNTFLGRSVRSDWEQESRAAQTGAGIHRRASGKTFWFPEHVENQLSDGLDCVPVSTCLQSPRVSPEECERLHEEVQLLLLSQLQRGDEQRVEVLLAHTHTQLELLRGLNHTLPLLSLVSCLNQWKPAWAESLESRAGIVWF